MTDLGGLRRPLTHSEMNAWQTCKRGWWLTYFRELRKQHDLPSLPNIGNLYHAGLEQLYLNNLEDPAAFVRAQADGLVLAHPMYAAQIVKDAEMASIMLEGYMEWREAEGVDFGYSVVGVEETLEMPVGPYMLRSKIDTRLLREWDNSVLQLEHKTVSNLADIPKYAADAPQFLTYDLQAYLLAQQSGDDTLATDGVLLNMARRVKRTAKANPPFYGRHEVRHNVEQLRNHYRHIRSIGDEIAAATARLEAGESHQLVCPPFVNRNHTWACSCREVTTMLDDGSDVEGYLAEFYERTDPLARYEDTKEDA